MASSKRLSRIERIGLAIYLEELRNYQRRELRKIELPGKLGTLAVTGKLVIGLVGFMIIVAMLNVTFYAMADKYETGTLGGRSIVGADVIRDEETGPTVNDNWNSEGDTTEFGVDYDQPDWDWSNNTHLVMIEVTFAWHSNDLAGGQAGNTREMSLEIHSTNSTKDPIIVSDNNFHGELTIQWFINDVPEQYNASADDVESFEMGLEVPGEGISGIARFEQDNSAALFPDVDVTITSKVILWHLENIEVIA